MKFLHEYRNPEVVKEILRQIRDVITKPWVIMEICGGQTHAIIRHGLDQLLPKEIELVHGPGCPVCVTPLDTLEKAIHIAGQPDVIFTSYGDMLRVPGNDKDLLMVKSEGGDIRIVYSPLEAVEIARNNPDKQVVFLAVGFETTAPGHAMAIMMAKKQQIANFSIISSHVLVPPAMQALLSSPDNRVQGYLAAGHVCAIMGWQEYEEIAQEFKIPIVPTGFEPIDILEGILMVVKQLEAGQYQVSNQYKRIVNELGNPAARKAMLTVFERCDRNWRGIGPIPGSGLQLTADFADFDAVSRFAVSHIKTAEPEQCISGQVLQGLAKPNTCPAFGKECTPSHPLGATMVSSEGACAAYYKYQPIS